MTPELLAAAVPLKTDAHGVIRVGGTRLTLDTLVSAYLDGATAEQIAEQYPAVALADIYACLSYYLRHRSEIDAYLARGGEHSTRLREDAGRRHGPWPNLRQRLIARASH